MAVGQTCQRQKTGANSHLQNKDLSDRVSIMRGERLTILQHNPLPCNLVRY